MKKLNLILLYPLLLVIVLTSCSSQQNIANLSFVDVSLNYSSVDFEIVDLKPITMSAESLFGVSENEFNSALLDRSKFNSGNGTSFGSPSVLRLVARYLFRESVSGRLGFWNFPVRLGTIPAETNIVPQSELALRGSYFLCKDCLLIPRISGNQVL